MSNTISAPKNQIDRLEEHIIRLERMVVHIMDELHRFHGNQTEEEAREELRRFKETYEYEVGEPEYATDAWWEWAIKQGESDRQAGRYTTIRNKEELKNFFDNL